MIFSTSTFDDLTTLELYRIIQLRQNVFVVEQDCVYMDLDDLDLNCIHVRGIENDELVCYARILDSSFFNDDYVHIGRVVVSQKHRSEKLGHRLMQYCIEYCFEGFGSLSIKISAQEHLQDFYNNLGFKRVGTMYLEDDIPHVAMIRSSGQIK